MRVFAHTVALLLVLGCSACGQPTSRSELASIERVERENDQARRAILAQEVASGEKSSDEAACDYRLGLWDDDLKACFDRDDPSIRPPPVGAPPPS